MRNENEESLKTIIDRMLKSYRLDDGYQSVNIKKAWEDMTGTAVANQTEDIHFNRGVLHIRMKSPAMSQEFSYAREKIRKRLNENLGRELIREVVIH